MSILFRLAYSMFLYNSVVEKLGYGAKTVIGKESATLLSKESSKVGSEISKSISPSLSKGLSKELTEFHSLSPQVSKSILVETGPVSKVLSPGLSSGVQVIKEPTIKLPRIVEEAPIIAKPLENAVPKPKSWFDFTSGPSELVATGKETAQKVGVTIDRVNTQTIPKVEATLGNFDKLSAEARMNLDNAGKTIEKMGKNGDQLTKDMTELKGTASRAVNVLAVSGAVVAGAGTIAGISSVVSDHKNKNEIANLQDSVAALEAKQKIPPIGSQLGQQNTIKNGTSKIKN